MVLGIVFGAVALLVVLLAVFIISITVAVVYVHRRSRRHSMADHLGETKKSVPLDENQRRDGNIQYILSNSDIFQ